MEPQAPVGVVGSSCLTPWGNLEKPGETWRNLEECQPVDAWEQQM